MSKNLKRIEQAKRLIIKIESVDHEDSAALDEIDLLFTVILENKERRGKVTRVCNDYGRKVLFQLYGSIEQQLYSRSRDALKAARPEGWAFEAEQKTNFETSVYTFGFWSIQYHDFNEDNEVCFPLLKSPELKTEELAEFHAIVQAWIYVWENE